MFQVKTKVQAHASSLIPVHGFSFTKISEITSSTKDYNFLVDVIGVLSGMSTEREYVRDGKVTRMIVIELTDHR
ncbi:hypothetical protein MTR_7g032985 [Medicago truncatula]|uniref:Replication factor A protein n=1 Tax=Medicago truncatula TaxID=3880 RepID=A0A072TXC8_MEDTR|nr:hypothetical protein MTR_7g032985 [Medicago truncatula]